MYTPFGLSTEDSVLGYSLKYLKLPNNSPVFNGISKALPCNRSYNRGLYYPAMTVIFSSKELLIFMPSSMDPSWWKERKAGGIQAHFFDNNSGDTHHCFPHPMGHNLPIQEHLTTIRKCGLYLYSHMSR
jgi:hypothetical protein